MSYFFTKPKLADADAERRRIERAAEDKRTLAAQIGPRPAPVEYSGPLEQAMAAVEEREYNSPEYKGRIDAATILRARDSCLGALMRAVGNGQWDEAQAMHHYAEACRAEADQLVRQPTAALALIRERVKGVIPKQAFESDHTRQWIIDHNE